MPLNEETKPKKPRKETRETGGQRKIRDGPYHKTGKIK